MPLYDFECVFCHKIFEDIKPHTAKYSFCPHCHHVGKKLLSTPRIAVFASGFKAAPLLRDSGTEMDTKKEDIFGRKFSELPDEEVLESKYHEEIETYEKEAKQEAPLEKKLNTMEKVFGKKRLKEKWKAVN